MIRLDKKFLFIFVASITLVMVIGCTGVGRQAAIKAETKATTLDDQIMVDMTDMIRRSDYQLSVARIKSGESPEIVCKDSWNKAYKLGLLMSYHEMSKDMRNMASIYWQSLRTWYEKAYGDIIDSKSAAIEAYNAKMKAASSTVTTTQSTQ